MEARHSNMNMNMDMDAPSPASTPSSPMDPGMLGNSMQGGGQMQMWFQATINTTLWFKGWDLDNPGKYAASCIGLFIVGLVWESLHNARRHLSDLQYNAAHCGTQEPGHSANPRTRFWKVKSIWLGHTLVYMTQVILAYLLMLAVMTYNLGLFIVIVLGLAIGFFFFSPLRHSSQGYQAVKAPGIACGM